MNIWFQRVLVRRLDACVSFSISGEISALLDSLVLRSYFTFNQKYRGNQFSLVESVRKQQAFKRLHVLNHFAYNGRNTCFIPSAFQQNIVQINSFIILTCWIISAIFCSYRRNINCIFTLLEIAFIVNTLMTFGELPTPSIISAVWIIFPPF